MYVGFNVNVLFLQTNASIAASFLTSCQLAKSVNKPHMEWSHIHASIVLATYQTSTDMNKLTQKLSRVHANIVTNAVAARQIARHMNKLTRH